MGRIADMEWLCEQCEEDTVAIEEIRGPDNEVISVCQTHYNKFEEYLSEADTITREE
tara:strand:- start:628 stop:798 length:171 start_codon:yes stop_codon:yes gene_type:complete